MRRQFVLLCFSLFLVIPACEAVTSDPGEGAPTEETGIAPIPSVSPAGGGLTGTWTGTVRSHFGDTAAFTVELIQVGPKVTGSLHIPTAVCNKESTVSGTVAGNQVNFGATHGEITATFTGTVSGKAMFGPWESPAGSTCRADNGTWEASKAG